MIRRPAALLALAFLACLLVPTAAKAGGETSFHYVRMSDGVDIAVRVWYPPSFDENDDRRWPALFVMDGYGGAGNPIGDSGFFGVTDKYVVVYASIRGTGCSGGRFDLFSERSSRDGYAIIEDWIVEQPWSSGLVGLTGQSYSGITAMLVAATNPPHVEATAVSGLVGDLYRDILYRGGILNAGFPVLWSLAARPRQELDGNRDEHLADARCRENLPSRGADDLGLNAAEVVARVLTEPHASPESWAVTHSLVQRAKDIRAPIEIDQQAQDTQTGPRGGYVLWEAVPDSVPKRLVLANGDHNPYYANPHVVDATRGAWLDCWLLESGRDCDRVNSPDHRVVTYFERRWGEGDGAVVEGVPYHSSDWPLPETRWTRHYLHSDGTLAESPAAGEGEVSYASTPAGRQASGRQGRGASDLAVATFADGPDQARWTLEFSQPTAIDGPINLTLWAKSTAADTDFFVDVLDRDRVTGDLQYLQRGMLRASLRAVDIARSGRVSTGPHRGEIYRPYHPFLESEALVPGRPYRFDIEIYPLSHVFRTGHELVLQLHAPPPSDALSTTDLYVSGRPPAVNTVLQGPEHRSSILLPALRTLPPIAPEAPACGELFGVPCLKRPVL